MSGSTSISALLLFFSLKVVSDSFGTSWTIAQHAPRSMGFPRQEYCSGLPFPSLGDLTEPKIKPASPALAGRFLTAEHKGSPNKSLGL